jgi:hypothetical protein
MAAAVDPRHAQTASRLMADAAQLTASAGADRDGVAVWESEGGTRSRGFRHPSAGSLGGRRGADGPAGEDVAPGQEFPARRTESRRRAAAANGTVERPEHRDGGPVRLRPRRRTHKKPA